MLRIPPMAPMPRTPAANAPAGPESKAVRRDDWGAAVHMVLWAVLASKRAGEAIMFMFVSVSAALSLCVREALRRDRRARARGTRRGATRARRAHTHSRGNPTLPTAPREERAGGTTWASCCPLRW